jgi:integrase
MSAMSASSATATVLLVGCRLDQQDAASGERRVADRGTEVREVAPQDQAARLARGGASGLPGECPPPRKQSDAPLFPHRKNGGNAHGEPDWSQPIEPGTFYRNVFKPAVKRAGLENVRLHDLRHTCASILLTAGMSPYELSEQLGHSGYQITLDVYARWIPDQEEAHSMEGKVTRPAAAKPKTGCRPIRHRLLPTPICPCGGGGRCTTSMPRSASSSSTSR